MFFGVARMNVGFFKLGFGDHFTRGIKKDPGPRPFGPSITYRESSLHPNVRDYEPIHPTLPQPHLNKQQVGITVKGGELGLRPAEFQFSFSSCGKAKGSGRRFIQISSACLSFPISDGMKRQHCMCGESWRRRSSLLCILRGNDDWFECRRGHEIWGRFLPSFLKSSHNNNAQEE